MSQGASGASRYREALLVLALLALVLAVDVLVRTFDHRLSGNIAHIRAIPDIIAEYGQAGAGSVLVLGNSLTNNGVNVQRLGEMVGRGAVAKVTPDATSLWDWQCLLDHEVIGSGASFDTVVLGFAWHQLSDSTRADPSRLAAYFCRMGDLAQPRRIGLQNSADIGEFIAAGTLRVHAMRDTLRNRILTLLVPGYQQFTQEGNRRAGEAGGTLDPQSYKYETLEALAGRLERKGTRLVVIAMPVRDGYELDPGILDLADRGVVHLLDYRNLAGIERGHFEDSMHLTRAGQHLLTSQLGTDLTGEARALTGEVRGAARGEASSGVRGMQ